MKLSFFKKNGIQRYADLKERKNEIQRYADLKEEKNYFGCDNDDDCGSNLYCCDYIVYKSCCKGGINNYYNHPYNKIPIKVKIEENKYI
jgi:hypothetical protein